MCGMVGFFSHSKDKHQILKSMLSVVYYRGPDDSGFFEDGYFGIGHNRLAIIDTISAKQPMMSDDGRFVLVFNGEIYNYLELRQHLIQKGEQFKTYSDTEVLLKMYERYGKESLGWLNGMFAFVIYDTEKKEAFIARDRFGIKPFYYTQTKDIFVFASEIKSILKHPNVKKDVDKSSVHEYITFQLMLKKHTLFKDIFSLEPATYMVIKDGCIKEKKVYWQLSYEIDDRKSMECYSDELMLLLEHSSYMQLRSDVPVGAFLSGGIDSSIVATMGSKNYYGEFQTFCGSFKDGKEFDETHYAKIVSDDISSKHYELFPKPKDFIDSFENIIYHLDYPEAGPGVFSQYMISKLASEHVKVVLGGQGVDEIFGGYTRYAIAYLEQALKGAILETSEEGQHIVTLNSIIPNLPQLQNYIPLLKQQFSSGLFDSMDERYFSMIDRSSSAKHIYSRDILEDISQEQLLDKFKQVFNQPDTKSYFNKMTYFDTKTLLPALLHIEDRVSMAHSLESRVPLLDHRIAELATKMPPNMKFAGGKTKSVLIKAVENILPKEIIERKDKMGFPTPINKWLSGELKEYALDILTSQKAKQRGYLNTDTIEKQINESGKFSRDMWGALSLEMWHRRFID
ncbi:MAG: asparagine synthase (glutamine-hydrolyzing) [Campylobacterales bacterium]